MSNVVWLKWPQDHDYPAAADYLGMLAGPDLVSRLIDELHAATPEHKKAKDILRAARLTLLPADNPHVASDLSKIKKSQPLSPILHLSCVPEGSLRSRSAASATPTIRAWLHSAPPVVG
jgi:hypothetical protein